MTLMWITRNALSRGIYQVEGNIRGVGFFYVNKALGHYVIGSDCFHTREEAVQRAEFIKLVMIGQIQRRLDNPKGLSAQETEKQTKKLEKLQALSFEEVGSLT